LLPYLIRHYLQDVFKVSGRQVSPTEIENVIREHPSQFVTDVAVAGVKGDRLADGLAPRAWVVLSDTGKKQGVEVVLVALDKWVRSRLSKHKWLRGGFQVVDEASHNHGTSKDEVLSVGLRVRYRNFLLERYCGGNFRTSTPEANEGELKRSCDMSEHASDVFR
jgi:hypothetical protein